MTKNFFQKNFCDTTFGFENKITSGSTHFFGFKKFRQKTRREEILKKTLLKIPNYSCKLKRQRRKEGRRECREQRGRGREKERRLAKMLARKGTGILTKLYRSLAQKPRFTRHSSTFNPPPMCPGRDTSVEVAGCPFDCENEANACKPKVIKDLMSCQDKRAAMTCDMENGNNKKKKSEPKEPFKSMWETIPGWGEQDCILRLDNVHYKPSDKNTRVYQMTWEPCPRAVKRLRKICCYEDAKVPPQCKRRRGGRGGSACERDNSDLKQDYELLRKCMGKKIEKVTKCQKVAMPDCPAVASNIKCRVVRAPSDCQKICTPYPSYSECQRDEGKKPHPRECGCLGNTMMCEATMFLVRKKNFQLPPDLPAWPPRPK